MKRFLDENFLLKTNTAQRLYHEYAASMPVIDYHCHLSPQQIADDTKFENLSQAWLAGDHYKWRAMRANGIDERYCTGSANDWEKFAKWAETVPYTLRNPLYHWSHLELRRYFDEPGILNAQSGEKIYNHASKMLQTQDFSVRNLLRKMNVAVICTTDDPVDSLAFHQKIEADKFATKVLPTYRPDRAIAVEDSEQFLSYLKELETVSNKSITSFDHYISALKDRHDYFAQAGCSLSDHGLEHLYAEDFTEKELTQCFSALLSGTTLNELQRRKFISGMLMHFAEWDYEKGWVQQFHLGATRNNNSRMQQRLGRDTGHDSIGDFQQAKALSSFLDSLDRRGKLARTIIYNLNPADNEVMATMAGNFNDSSAVGKIQWGSAWWFLDQKDGMVKQLNTLSNMGLLGRFLGMLTDSRSFLSYPRHEYFRRILCDLFGDDIENGELPNDIDWTGSVVKDICYHNARNYFNWQDLPATIEK